MGYRSATVFGTISPNTTETIVSAISTAALESDAEVSGLSGVHRSTSGTTAGVMKASA